MSYENDLRLSVAKRSMEKALKVAADAKTTEIQEKFFMLALKHEEEVIRLQESGK